MSARPRDARLRNHMDHHPTSTAQSTASTCNDFSTSLWRKGDTLLERQKVRDEMATGYCVHSTELRAKLHD